jgi:hypothetical protein
MADAPANTDPKEGTVHKIPPHERFIASLIERGKREGPIMAAQVSMGNVDAILEADTVEDVWAAEASQDTPLVNGKDMVNVELQFNSILVAPSSDEYNAQLEVFANISATRLDTGQNVVINTGAADVVTRLVKFESLGALPIKGVIREQKAGKGMLLLLKPLPARATDATTE